MLYMGYIIVGIDYYWRICLRPTRWDSRYYRRRTFAILWRLHNFAIDGSWKIDCTIEKTGRLSGGYAIVCKRVKFMSCYGYVSSPSLRIVIVRGILFWQNHNDFVRGVPLSFHYVCLFWQIFCYNYVGWIDFSCWIFSN